MNNDLLTVLILLVIINFLILISWGLKKILTFLPISVPRKFLHVTAIMIAASSYLLVNNSIYLYVLGFLILGGNYFLVKKEVFEEKDPNKKNLGVFFVPITYLILLFAFDKYREIAMFSLLVMAFSDGIASIMGEFFTVKPYSLGKAKKSFSGSFAFWLTTLAIFYWATLMLPGSDKFTNIYSYPDIFIFAFFFATVLTLIEALCYFGFDNLFVPLLASIMLFIIFNTNHDTFSATQLLISSVLVLAVVTISAYAKFLTKDGIVAASVVGLLIFGFGGLKWAIPLVAFFFLSSILSKMTKSSGVIFEKGSRRDAFQVFANGGIPLVLLLIYLIDKNEIFYILYLTALATATADTWATEFGSMKKQKTISIVTLNEIPQGTSGGISLFGTFGGFLGAVLILLSGIYWINSNLLVNSVLIVLFGFLGMFIDSLIGATLQRKNICQVCGKETELNYHCGKPTKFHIGIKFLDNDSVNFLAIMFSVILLFFFTV